MRFTLGNFREDDSNIQNSDLTDFLKTLRGELQYQEASDCKQKILNVDESVDDAPNLGDLLCIRKILDGKKQQKYIDCIDNIYPEKQLGIEFRWVNSLEGDPMSIYSNTQIIQTRNFFKPTHSNFDSLDSYNEWTTLYFSKNQIEHTINDDTWVPVYVHSANIGNILYQNFPSEFQFELDMQVDLNGIPTYQLYVENRPVYILNTLIERSLQDTNIYYNDFKVPVAKPIIQPDDFYFKWKGTNQEQGLLARLPLIQEGEYDATVYWGDGMCAKFDSFDSDSAQHLYTLQRQERDIVLRGSIKGVSFEENENLYEQTLVSQRINLNKIQSNICPTDKKICEDGTLIGRNPNNNCAFYDCPEKLSIINTSDEGCFFLIGNDIKNNINFQYTETQKLVSSQEISFGDGYLSWKINFISDEQSEFTEFQISQFTLALERWSRVIKMNHQIEIDVNLVHESESNTIAFANTTYINQNGLAVAGQITWNTKFLSQNYNGTSSPFDEIFYDSEELYTEMYAVTLHEVGHVLGLGTRFNLDVNKMFIYNGTTGERLPFNYRSEYYEEDSAFWENLNPVYKGENAVNAYNRITGLNYDALPIEDSGGVGTRGAHLEEGIDTDYEVQTRTYIYDGQEVELPHMQYELMSGWHDYGGLPLSEITIGMLHDLGYEVDYSNADAYSIEGYPNNTPTPTITHYADDFYCTRDVKVCRDGTYLYRDSENECNFPECQDEVITRAYTPNYAHNQLVEIYQWGNLDISNSNGVFKNCKLFEKISATDSPIFPYDMSFMFKDCVNLVNVNVNEWNTESVTSMNGMFMNCNSLNCDLNNLNVINVVDMSRLFQNCQVFTSDLDKWNTNSVAFMSHMFSGCTNFKGSLRNWITTSVIRMDHMFDMYDEDNFFENEEIIKSGYMPNGIATNEVNNSNGDVVLSWDTRNVQDMSYMFRANRFLQIDSLQDNEFIGNWNTSSVTRMKGMFRSSAMFWTNENFENDFSSQVGYSSLKTKQVNFTNYSYTAWDVSNVNNMCEMFMSTSQFDFDFSTWNFDSIISEPNKLDGLEFMLYKLEFNNIGDYTLSSTNYDKLINRLNETNTSENITLHANLEKRTNNSYLSYLNLISRGWNIIDAGCDDCIDPTTTPTPTTTQGDRGPGDPTPTPTLTQTPTPTPTTTPTATPTPTNTPTSTQTQTQVECDGCLGYIHSDNTYSLAGNTWPNYVNSNTTYRAISNWIYITKKDTSIKSIFIDFYRDATIFNLMTSSDPFPDNTYTHAIEGDVIYLNIYHNDSSGVSVQQTQTSWSSYLQKIGLSDQLEITWGVNDGNSPTNYTSTDHDRGDPLFWNSGCSSSESKLLLGENIDCNEFSYLYPSERVQYNPTPFENNTSIIISDNGISATPGRKSGNMTFMFWFKIPEKNTSQFASLFWCPGSSSTNISANHTTTLNLYIDETKNSYGLIYGDGSSWTAPHGPIGPSEFDTNQKFKIDTWYHYAVTRKVGTDGTDDMELYINGMHYASKSWTINTGTFAFGREQDGESGYTFTMGSHAEYYLTQYMFDEIAIYDEALSHEQIRSAVVGDGNLHNIGTQLHCWWRMESIIEEEFVDNYSSTGSQLLMHIGSNLLSSDTPPSENTINIVANTGTYTQVGSDVIEIESKYQELFSLNENIVIAPNTDNEEYNQISAFGSLKLKFPVKYSHEVGTQIGTLGIRLPKYTDIPFSSSNTLLLWMDAADTSTIISETRNVNIWNDKSENNYTSYKLIQDEPINQPSTETESYHAYNVIEFLSTDTLMSNVPFTTTNSFTINIVVEILQVFNEESTLLSINGTNSPSFRITSGSKDGFYISFNQIGMGENKVFSPSQLTGMNIIGFNFNYANKLLEVFLNGASLGTTFYENAPNATNIINLFSDGSGANNIEGNLAEIIITSGIYTLSNKENIEQYLSDKWRVDINQ